MIPPQALHGPTVPSLETRLDVDELHVNIAGETLRVRGVPMQLDHLVLGNPRILMQVVDVLSDHRPPCRRHRGVPPRVSEIGLRSDPAVTVVERRRHASRRFASEATNS